MANSVCRRECPEKWSEWSEWLAVGLHADNRWRLSVLLFGISFASGRRTVTTCLRAAGVIRALLVKEDHGWCAFFATDPKVSVNDILEAFDDRATV